MGKLSHWEEQWVELNLTITQWEEEGIAPRKALVSMSEFGELWKHQYNPAYTESVSLYNAEVGYYTEEEVKLQPI